MEHCHLSGYGGVHVAVLLTAAAVDPPDLFVQDPSLMQGWSCCLGLTLLVGEPSSGPRGFLCGSLPPVGEPGGALWAKKFSQLTLRP